MKPQVPENDHEKSSLDEVISTDDLYKHIERGNFLRKTVEVVQDFQVKVHCNINFALNINDMT